MATVWVHDDFFGIRAGKNNQTNAPAHTTASSTSNLNSKYPTLRKNRRSIFITVVKSAKHSIPSKMSRNAILVQSSRKFSLNLELKQQHMPHSLLESPIQTFLRDNEGNCTKFEQILKMKTRNSLSSPDKATNQTNQSILKPLFRSQPTLRRKLQ